MAWGCDHDHAKGWYVGWICLNNFFSKGLRHELLGSSFIHVNLLILSGFGKRKKKITTLHIDHCGLS
jgi:hypothetical protein